MHSHIHIHRYGQTPSAASCTAFLHASMRTIQSTNPSACCRGQPRPYAGQKATPVVPSQTPNPHSSLAPGLFQTSPHTYLGDAAGKYPPPRRRREVHSRARLHRMMVQGHRSASAFSDVWCRVMSRGTGTLVSLSLSLSLSLCVCVCVRVCPVRAVTG